MLLCNEDVVATHKCQGRAVGFCKTNSHFITKSLSQRRSCEESEFQSVKINVFYQQFKCRGQNSHA